MHFDYKLFMHNAALNNKKFVLQYVVFVYIIIINVTKKKKFVIRKIL